MTDNERRRIRGLAYTKNNRQIALAIGISTATVGKELRRQKEEREHVQDS